MTTSYGHYIRTRACCAPGAGPTGPEGPVGPAGETQIETASLFFSDLTLTGPDTSFLEYDNTMTTDNGKQLFMDGTTATAGITFSSATIGPNGAYVELYFHGDMEAGSAGTDHWIVFELVGSNQVIDIDTRSVQKGELLHMAFGPSAHRLVDGATATQTFCIDKASTYRVQVRTGRAYTLTEMRLVIKVIQY